VTKILLGMACLPLTGCTPRAPAVVIRAVTVVDVINGSLRGNQTVLVAGNRITAVGPADQVRTPDDADLLDATGGFLIPGLWDMHVHSVANVAVDRSVKSVAAQDWHFPLFLAYGVTGSQHERRNG
jgi:imidazolonepropionase-like amidohydrolase